MSKNSMKKAGLILLGLCVLGGAAVVAVRNWPRPPQETPQAESAIHSPIHGDKPVGESKASAEELLLQPIEFPRNLWKSAGIELASVEEAPLAENLELTGKIALNEEALAHVFPLVDGRVEQVHVQFGQRVRKGAPLVIIQSKEVGTRMLQLFQDRLRLSFAKIKNQWTQDVGANTLALVEAIRSGTSIEAIEAKFKDRPMGEYREQLMTPYVAFFKARLHLTRLSPLSNEGAIAGRQLVEAQSDHDAAKAVLESLLEQVSQDVRQTVQLSGQSVEEAQTSASISEANLRILGFSDEELKSIDPTRQGSSLAHYVITAPFDGTVISKDVVLMERVGPEHQIFAIADLSTVWVTADIYESQLSLLSQLRDKTVEVFSDSWPGRKFTARIFYTGDVVQEMTRTIALRATAENTEGLLKPGMFVRVKLPGLQSQSVLQLPPTAIQDHEGKAFVFVQTAEGEFQRRDVVLGRRNRERVEVVSGISRDDRVVSKGGFALKSKMLAGLLSD